MAQDFFSQFDDEPSDTHPVVIEHAVTTKPKQEADDFFKQFDDHTNDSTPVKKERALPEPTAKQLTAMTTDVGPKMDTQQKKLFKEAAAGNSGSDKPGMLEDAWDFATKAYHAANQPMVDLRSGKMKDATDAVAKEHPILGGAANTLIDAISSLSSPFSVGMGALSGGSLLAEKAGLPTVAKWLEGPGQAAAAGMMIHGGNSVVSPDSTMADRMGGLLEGGLGFLGFKRPVGKIGPATIADDIHPEITEKPNLPPEFAQTVEEANQGRVAPTVKSGDDAAYELAQNRFNMGKAKESFDNAPTNDVQPNTPVETKTSNKPRYRLDTDSGAYIPIDDKGNQTGPAQIPGKTLAPEIAAASKYKSLDDINKVASLASPQQKDSIYHAVSGNARAILTSVDVSAPLRQGLPLATNKEFYTSLPGMFKAFGSENAAKLIDQSIMEHPNAQKVMIGGKEMPSVYDRMGLKLGGKEEVYRNSKLAQEIVPLVGRSERAYNAYLNKLRADTANSLISQSEALGFNPKSDDVLLKKMGDLVNNATGRGTMGKTLESALPALNEVFFAPRLMASRVNTYKTILNPMTYFKEDPVIRKQALKSLLALVGIGNTIGQLAKYGGATVSSDPTNTDFGKIKIGPNRLDNYGGFQQYAVGASQLLSGKTTSSTSGNTTDLTQGKFGMPTRATIAQQFLTNKLAPIPSFVWAWAQGKEFDGTPFDVKKEIVARTIPIVMQDLNDIYKSDPQLFPASFGKHPNLTKAGLGAAAIFGSGTQSYGR